MFFTKIALLPLSFASLALAAPSKRQTAIDDVTVLNFALTLEHLENAFYAGALAKFDAEAFANDGFAPWVRERFSEIAAHEKTHVAFLSGALGDNATQPCNYSFPYTDPKSFAALSQILEGVGVSAYSGAAQFISNKEFLTAAASILSTEARHASWVASAVNKIAGWSGAFDVPLGLNEVFTLAAGFITACPSTNPTLPVKALPSLTFGNKAAPGSTSSVTFTPASATSGNLFVVFLTGLSTESAQINNGSVDIPADLVGTVYAVVSTNATAVNDDTVVAGPAILEFNRDSNGNLVA